MHRDDVEFAVEGGVTLRGWLYVPDGPPPHPAITMAHGFAGVKDHGLDRFAAAFAAAGFVVLVHDHRGFGASDGSPRFDVDPWVADRRLASSDLLLGEPAGGRCRTESDCGAPAMPVDTRSCWGPPTAGCGRWWRRCPTISGYQQSLRRVAPDLVPALEASFADDERRQFHGAPPATQAVVSADLVGACRLPFTAGRRVLHPTGARWRVGEHHDPPVDPRRAHVRAGHLDLPRLPYTLADDRGPTRHDHRHRPRARRLRAGAAAQEAGHCRRRSLRPVSHSISTNPAVPQSPGSRAPTIRKTVDSEGKLSTCPNCVTKFWSTTACDASATSGCPTAARSSPRQLPRRSSTASGTRCSSTRRSLTSRWTASVTGSRRRAST